MQFSKDQRDIGSKLGPKLVKLISDAIVATKVRLLDTEHRARTHSMQEIIDRTGHEIADLYRPVWQAVSGDTELPDWLNDHMESITSGRHQWQAIVGFGLGSSGAGSAISQIMNNYLANTVRDAIAKLPQLVPQPEELIQLGTKGALDWSDVYNFCHGQGYDDRIIDSIRIGTYAWPDLTTTLELLRRNLINIDDAKLYMTRTGIQPETQYNLLQLANTPLSPPDLADMVVRGIKTRDEALPVAAASGMSPDDFDAVVLDTGEPPGLMQLLEGFRRGFIDQATLQHGILQSRYRNEWIPLLTELRYSPMSVADAVNAAVQGHMSLADAAKVSDQNGLEPGAFDTLYQTAGEPLSRTEMSDLYNRGLVTEADVKQALRESRIKDKYVNDAFALHQRIIPATSLSRALEYGAVSHADAIKKAMDYGYDAQDAKIIVESGSNRKMQTYRNRVVSAVETAYEDNTIPLADAMKLIQQMGYEQSEAQFILQSAELRRSAKIVNQVATSVRSRYVAHVITRQTASNDLDSVGIPPAQRDYMLSLWDIEYSARVKHLTEAQIVKAVKLTLITPDDGLARLVDMGYNATDAQLLIDGA